MNKKTEQILNDILKYKGKDFAVIGTIVECNELTAELMKNIYRGKDNIKDIFEETADVYIMLEFIKKIYNFSDKEIWNYLDNKMPDKWSEKIESWKES
ncbi:MAG TPA: hypothetical protein PKJ33_01135 [Alphaproteobacteria bacterium]|nr:hypothetical protein [Alphaproteobacteria bacterium]